MDLRPGMVAVVTGGASGIGEALARRSSAEGLAVVIADIDDAGANRVAAELVSAGADAMAVPTDVVSADAVDALLQATIGRFGAAHVIFNNAGVGVADGLLWENSIREWEHTLGVDLWGPINVARTFAPFLVQQNEPAHIVTTASMAGIVTGPGMAAYRVAKFGVVGLAETLYAEMQLLRAPVGVSVLCPGWVKTPIGFPGADEADIVIDPRAAHLGDMMREFVETAIEPETVVELVFDAIRNEDFYIFTHPEWNKGITYRAQNMVEGVNPRPGPLTKEVWRRMGEE